MRTLIAALFLMGSVGASSAGAEPPSRFEVPRLHDASADTRVPTHEVLLPADVVARPGETPSEALARALHASDDTSAERRGKGR